MSRTFQLARRGSIFRQPVCIGREITTAKSLGGIWIGGPAIPPLAGASCHPAVSYGPASQARDSDNVISTAGGRSFQCQQACSARSHFQKHPDKDEDS